MKRILLAILSIVSLNAIAQNDGIVPPSGQKQLIQLSQQARLSQQPYQILQTDGNKKIKYWDSDSFKGFNNIGKVDSVAISGSMLKFFDINGNLLLNALLPINTDTRFTNPRFINDSLVFDVLNVVTNTVVGQEVLDNAKVIDTDTRTELSIVNDSLKVDLVDVKTGNIISTSYIDNVINQNIIIPPDTRDSLSFVNDSLKIEVWDKTTNTLITTYYVDNVINKPDLIQSATNDLRVDGTTIVRGSDDPANAKSSQFTSSIYNHMNGFNDSWVNTTYDNSLYPTAHFDNNGDVWFGAYNSTTAHTSAYWALKGALFFNKSKASLMFGSHKTADYDNLGAFSFIGGVLNRSTANGVFIGSGFENSSSGDVSAIVNGQSNQANNIFCFIGNGDHCTTNGTYNFIGCGGSLITNGDYNFSGGGLQNTTGGLYSGNLSGVGNNVNAYSAFNLGGSNNSVTGQQSINGTGANNSISTSYSVSLSGSYNTLSNAPYKFIGTGTNNNLTSLSQGTFVLVGNNNNLHNIGGGVIVGDNNDVSGGLIISGSNDTISTSGALFGNVVNSKTTGRFSSNFSSQYANQSSYCHINFGFSPVTFSGQSSNSWVVTDLLETLANGASDVTGSNYQSNIRTTLKNGQVQFRMSDGGAIENLTQNDVTPVAALEVVSTTKGVLFPRLTASEISTWQSSFNTTTDVTGLGGVGNEKHSRQGEVVYDLSQSKNMRADWNGSVWVFTTW